MDLNEPIDEDGAHPLVDVGLVLHVRRSDGSGVLLASKVEVLFCCVGLRIWEFGDDGEEWHIWVGERVCWRLKRYAKNMTMAQDVCWISLRSTAAVHACNRSPDHPRSGLAQLCPQGLLREPLSRPGENLRWQHIEQPRTAAPEALLLEAQA